MLVATNVRFIAGIPFSGKSRRLSGHGQCIKDTGLLHRDRVSNSNSFDKGQSSRLMYARSTCIYMILDEKNIRGNAARKLEMSLERNNSRNVFTAYDGIPCARGSTVLRVRAHVLGSQRSRNIAVFGHRFCKTRWSYTKRPVLVRAPSNLANLLSASLPPATCSLLAPSFHRGGSNKSTGFYSCLSDILYSAGDPDSPASPFLPRLRI